RSPQSPSPGASPAITAVKPTSGASGDDVILTGQGFGTSGTVLFGSVPATTKSWTDTSITVTVPAINPGLLTITLTPTGGSPFQADFTISSKGATNMKTPAIEDVKPASGAPGMDVVLTGQGFGTPGTVLFGSVPATTKSWNDTSITATVPTLGS